MHAGGDRSRYFRSARENTTTRYENTGVERSFERINTKPLRPAIFGNVCAVCVPPTRSNVHHKCCETRENRKRLIISRSRFLARSAPLISQRTGRTAGESEPANSAPIESKLRFLGLINHVFSRVAIIVTRSISSGWQQYLRVLSSLKIYRIIIFDKVLRSLECNKI